jgi:hypothetical protein
MLSASFITFSFRILHTLLKNSRNTGYVDTFANMETEGLHLEAEHPVDEALGCMIPFGIATTVAIVLMVILIGG